MRSAWARGLDLDGRDAPPGQGGFVGMEYLLRAKIVDFNVRAAALLGDALRQPLGPRPMNPPHSIAGSMSSTDSRRDTGGTTSARLLTTTGRESKGTCTSRTI